MIKILMTNKTIKLLITFIIIYFSAGFFVTNDLWPIPMIVSVVCALFFVLLYNNYKLNYNLLSFSLLLLSTMWISLILNEDNLLVYIYYTVGYLSAVLYVNKYSLSEFKENFTNIMMCIAFCSAIAYVLYLASPGLEYYNTFSNAKGTLYSNLLLFIHRVGSHRNFGFFWEPGAYQTFLNLALFFELAKDEPRKKAIMLFIFNIITTFSTTGYIALFIILYIFVFSKKELKKMVPSLVLIFLAIFGFQDLFSSVLDSTSSTVFGKLENFFYNEEYGNNWGALTSSQIRYFSVVKVLEVFINHPLIGVGYNNLNKLLFLFTSGMNTCTFLNYFAVYGMFYGIICLLGYWNISTILGRGKNKLLIFFLFFVITMSENYIHSFIFYVFIFYGYKIDRVFLDM